MLFIVILLVLGVIGGVWANSKGRNPWGWGIACALTGIFGLAVLAFQKPLNRNGSSSYALPGNASSDRWNALIEVDPDIAAAAAEARRLGPGYEAQLSQKFLALNDKSYLPQLLQNLRDSARSANTLTLDGPLGEVTAEQLADGTVKIVKGLGTGRIFDNMDALRRHVGAA